MIDVLNADIQTADVQKTTKDYTLPQNIYDRLLDIEVEDGGVSKIVPSLAEDWEISGDGLEYTFHLRQGVKFHNGNDFTADDVVYTFHRLLTVENGVNTELLDQVKGAAEVIEGSADTLEGVEKIDDYTELLLPDNLLREGSVIYKMVKDIPEEDWKDQVQIIGWLYQYYNTEAKDKVFADLKKKIKITKEKIPAATQLFTPDWIVRYMVENSLGRLWLEGHPNDDMKANWKYYLDEAEQEPEVEAQLDEIRKSYKDLKPEDLKCIDPCCGSGHILCYMFDGHFCHLIGICICPLRSTNVWVPVSKRQKCG
ncbi:MAG: hypothetical protein HFG57_06750, partial [Lachnospiraceae bacterium]|nr:hypothetical protein [Lachnospiraceae bacterium]